MKGASDTDSPIDSGTFHERQSLTPLQRDTRVLSLGPEWLPSLTELKHSQYAPDILLQHEPPRVQAIIQTSTSSRLGVCSSFIVVASLALQPLLPDYHLNYRLQ